MELVGNTFFFDWETSLIVWLQTALGPGGAAVASFLSSLGEELVLVSIICFLYLCYDKRFGRYAGLNVLVCLAVAPMIKNVFIRRRPYFDDPRIRCLKPVDSGADIYDISAQGYSFPSMHASNSTAVYGSVARYKKTRWLTAVCVAVPLLVGVSRFILGVHYPTDVLCGWILGAAAVFLVPWLEAKIPDRRLFYGLILLVTLPGLFFCRSEDYFTGIGMLTGFMLGSWFEEKYVDFDNTREPLRCVLRLLAGILLFVGINTILKLPFSKAFLDSGTYSALLVRTVRYFLDLFLLVGPFPLLFRYTDRFFDRRK